MFFHAWRNVDGSPCPQCAKLFVEALARKPTFQISSVDYKTSYRTVILPGFINTGAYVPGIAVAGSVDVAEATEAALSGGFTTIQIEPTGLSASIEDALTLDVAHENTVGLAHCDYSLGVAATADNASRLSADLIAATKSLFLPSNSLTGAANKVAAIAAHFSAWPIDKPIVTDAEATDLASVLLLASLNGRSVHITNVQSQADIGLIAMSKGKDLKVTCDVSVYSLFLTREAYPGSKCLPSAQDQEALWANLDIIDTFSVGTLPYRLAVELGHSYSPRAGSDEATRLLLSAVNDGRLTLDDLTTRLSDNPRAIFDLPLQADTYVEVEIDRKVVIPKREYWSPIENQTLAGAVHRVVLRGNTVFLDGTFFPSRPSGGRDVSESVVMSKPERKQARFSMSQSTRPSLQSLGFSSKPFEAVASPASPLLNSTPFALSRSPKITSRSPRLDGIDVASQPSLMALAAQTSPPAPERLFNPVATLSKLVANSAFSHRHILSVRAFSREDLHTLFGVASEMRMLVERNIPIEILKGRVLCTVFYESSTRTSSSFEAAMNRLGGSVVAVTPTTSSMTKGESLADTVRTLGCYGDAIVLRHPAAGSAQTAAKFSPVPIINAGDGIGEHPTQVSPLLRSAQPPSLTSFLLPPPGLPRHLHDPRGARNGQRPHDHHGRRPQERPNCPQSRPPPLPLLGLAQLRLSRVARDARERQGRGDQGGRPCPRDDEPRQRPRQHRRVVRDSRPAGAVREPRRVRVRQGRLRRQQRAPLARQAALHRYAPSPA